LGHVKKIKRSLLYKILDRLVDRKLILQEKKNGKAFFVPQPPDALAKLAEEAEGRARSSKEDLLRALPELKAKYNLSTERPIIRFFEGIEGLRAMQEDKLESGAKELYFIRTARAEEYRETFGTWFAHYLKRQADLGVKAYAITVDDEYTNHDPAIDKARNVIRTWIRPQDYTAPIQIDTYGDKVSILAFGKEIFGILIESAPLATAMKDIFKLADRGAKTIEVTHNHPPVKPRSR
jgi:sugar-specific transcriptional regulator TrmB